MRQPTNAAVINETDARPSYEGAENILHDQAAEKMDELAAAWKEKADQKWAEINKETVAEKEDAQNRAI